MRRRDIHEFVDVALPCGVFLMSFFLLFVGLGQHKTLWYGSIALMVILFSLSRNKFKRISLTLISILPIVNYGFMPRYGFTLFDVLAVVIICMLLYYNLQRERYSITPLTYPFLFMFLTLLFSTIVAANVGFGISIIVTCLIFFLAAKSMAFFLFDENDIMAVLYCLLIPVIVSAMLGIYQGIFGAYSARLVNVFNPNVMVPGFVRAPGPLDNSLSFGQYLSVLTSFFVGFLLAGIRYGLDKKLLMVLSLVAVGTGMGGLVASVSRMAIVASIIIVPVSLLSLYRSRGIMIVSVLLIMMVVFQDQLINLVISDPVARRFLTAQYDLSTGRLSLYENAFRQFLESPIVGIGTGNLNYASHLTDPSQRMVPGGHVESVYLSYLVTNGLLGFIALIYFVSKVITHSYHLFKRSPDPFLKSVSFGLFVAFISNAVNMATNPASLPGKMGLFDCTNFYMFWVLLVLMMVVNKTRETIPALWDLEQSE